MPALLIMVAAAAQLAAPQPKEAFITLEDYPTSAMAKNQHGAVIFNLVTDPRGKPLKCAVESIKDTDFGALVCKKAMRARFQPATDRSGAPVHGVFHSVMNFWLPDERGSDKYPYAATPDLAVTVQSSPNGPREGKLAVLFDASGKPSDCAPDAGEESAAQSKAACDFLLGQWNGGPLKGAEGLSVPHVRNMKIAFVPDAR